MDALPSLHPNNAGLARRVAAVKEKLAALTAEQLAAVTPAFSDTEFTAAVGRLSAAAQVTAFAVQAPLPGAEYDSCGSTRSDTDAGRDLAICAGRARASRRSAATWSCNSVVDDSRRGQRTCRGASPPASSTWPSQAVQLRVATLRSYCDGVIDGNEIRGILNNSDGDRQPTWPAHDADIKAALATARRGHQGAAGDRAAERGRGEPAA